MRCPLDHNHSRKGLASSMAFTAACEVKSLFISFLSLEY